MINRILFIAILCMISMLSFAAKPDWAGQGKPDTEQVEGMVKEMKDADRRSDMLERGKPGKGKKDKDQEDNDYDDDEEFECELSKEECAALRSERKAQREMERGQRTAERGMGMGSGQGGSDVAGQANRQDADRRGQAEANQGLEAQAAIKAEAEQKELDKGSDKGQEMRQQKSKKWWRFWE